jgi:hypothetical protein
MVAQDGECLVHVQVTALGESAFGLLDDDPAVQGSPVKGLAEWAGGRDEVRAIRRESLCGSGRVGQDIGVAWPARCGLDAGDDGGEAGGEPFVAVAVPGVLAEGGERGEAAGGQ